MEGHFVSFEKGTPFFNKTMNAEITYYSDEPVFIIHKSELLKIADNFEISKKETLAEITDNHPIDNKRMISNSSFSII